MTYVAHDLGLLFRFFAAAEHAPHFLLQLWELAIQGRVGRELEDVALQCIVVHVAAAAHARRVAHADRSADHSRLVVQFLQAVAQVYQYERVASQHGAVMYGRCASRNKQRLNILYTQI